MPSYNISSSNNYIIYTDTTGSTIYDSGGPSANYNNSENIFFLIAPAYATGTLTLNITSFNSEANYDYLRIYDGYVPTASFSYAGTTAGTPASLLAVLNGSPSLPITVTSSTGRAYLRWNSDGSVSSSGFALSWTGSGTYSVDNSSGVVLNQYAATFPRTASSSSYITIPKTLFSGSGTVLSASKDILIGFWAKLDNGMQGSANSLGILGIAGTDGPAGSSNLTIQRASSTDNLRIYIADTNSGFTSTATDMVMGGGTAANATYPPQWHHYGIALKKNSTTTANVRFYRDGQVFATNVHTKSSDFSTIQAIDDIVIGNFRSYASMTGVIQSAGGWSGSLDDIFLATITTGSTLTEYDTFFSNIYNSGNFSQPVSVITASLSASLNPLVIFNLRFEETGSLLNIRDYGSFGNYHTATLTASSPVAPYLTTTSSGISYTPYSSLAYSASVPAGAASLSSLSYNTGEASGSVTITVNRISGSDGSLSVNYFTRDLTALSGTNYTRTTGTLSWSNANTSSQTFSVPILYDNVYTSSTSFIVNLVGLSPGNYSSYPSAITSSVVTINDQEPGTFNWEVTSLSVYETASSATVNVIRTSGSYGAVTASLFYSSSAGTAVPKTGSAGQLIFSASQTTAQVVFPMTDDLVDEPDDPTYITFSSFTSTAGTAKTGSSGTLILTIIDNETGSVTFNTGSASVYENTSSYIFSIQRLYGGDQAQTASITIGGTAVSGTQYDIIYNSITQSSPFNIIWADQTKDTKYITASIYDNNLLDGNRTIIFGINSSSVSSIGPTSSFQLNILDYEITGSARFVTSSYSVTIPGSVNVQVERYNGQDVSASAIVDVSSSSTAVAGVDYVNVFPYTVNWANQESGSKNITVSTLPSWNPSTTLNLKFTSLTNLSSGSILTASVAITSTTINQSSQPYSTVNSNYVINDYGNLSSQFTRRTQQVPFSLNKKGTGRLRKP
jgi:hypothetical protein